MNKKNTNTKLHKAKIEQNNEFYTFYEDIEKEVENYIEHFKDKIIYCNCDNPQFSNFIKYFINNKERLQIKELLYSYLKEDGTGGYESEENKELFNKADIIITNPPFSLSNNFIDKLIQCNKKFLIISNNLQLFKINCFQYYKDKKIFYGVNTIKKFFNHNNDILYVPAVWLTNLKHNKKNKILNTKVFYEVNKYKYYDNTEIINVDKVKDLPIDYEGILGVPFTFLRTINEEQFQIISCGRYKINGKEKFARINIKHKKNYLQQIKQENLIEYKNKKIEEQINEEIFNKNYNLFKGLKFSDIFIFIKKGYNYNKKDKINEEQYEKINNKEDYNIIVNSDIYKNKKEYILKDNKYTTLKKNNYYLKTYADKIINKNLFEEEYYFNHYTFEFEIKEQFKEIDMIIIYHFNNIINNFKDLYGEKDVCKRINFNKLMEIIL